MILPAAFVYNVINTSGDQGRQFLDSLPDLLLDCTQRWDLSPGEPFLLSYNYVCPVTRADGSPAVLKLGVPNIELTSEINALTLYSGQGTCRILESDASHGLLLLERLIPGTMLSEIVSDDQATEIGASVMKKIQRPMSDINGFISLRGWFDELKNLRPRFGGGTGPFPEKTVEVVEGLVRDLFAENNADVLLHGGFHHYNILLSGRGWLAIDPKGVLGPADYEAGPFLLNPLGAMPIESEGILRTQRRIAILSEILGFDRQRLWRWAICHSLLSAWWDTAKDGSGGEYSRAWTEILLKVRV